MNEIKLKSKKLRSISNYSFVLPIDKSFVNNEYIDPNEEYDFDIRFKKSKNE